MRITKEIAANVAKQLVSSKKEEIKSLKSQQSEFITTIYEASLSELIKQAFKKHKGFLYTTTSIRLIGSGLPVGYKSYQLTKVLPQCNSCGQFPMNDEQADVIINFSNKIEDLEKSTHELQNNIEAALFNLRTYNNVEKEFPEAFKLLPASKVNTGLMVNIKDIRCKLDKGNC